MPGAVFVRGEWCGLKKQGEKAKGSPYKVLYWMGGALVLLVVGVLLLAKLAGGNGGGPPPEPERTVIWLFDPANESAPAQAILLEESRLAGKLSAVAFAAPADLQAVHGGSHGSRAQKELAAQVGREVHNRVFLPYSVVVTLIDAASGVKVEGRDMDGVEAITYVRQGGDAGPDRAARVMLALADAVNTKGISMGVSDGLRLAGQVDTDIDLMGIPDVLARWSQYQNPNVAAVPDLEAAKALLAPDQQP
jgi:hypothetical protein